MILPLLALTLVLGQHAPLMPAFEPLGPEQEAQVQRVGKGLRCAVCQGVAITDSPASMARAQLEKVRELVREGKSDEEIREYFVARYGEWVLLSPPAHGLNWVVWLGPALLVLGGAVVIARLMRAPVAKSAAAPSSKSLSEEDPYLAKVRAELER